MAVNTIIQYYLTKVNAYHKGENILKNLFICLFFIFSASVLANHSAPNYCFGVSQQDDRKEIELELKNNTYSMGFTLEILTKEKFSNQSSYAGPVSGVFFTGGGSASWKMSLTEGSGTLKTGVLTISFYNSHQAINGGNGYSEQKYNVVCE